MKTHVKVPVDCTAVQRGTDRALVRVDTAHRGRVAGWPGERCSYGGGGQPDDTRVRAAATCFRTDAPLDAHTREARPVALARCSSSGASDGRVRYEGRHREIFAAFGGGWCIYPQPTAPWSERRNGGAARERRRCEGHATARTHSGHARRKPGVASLACRRQPPQGERTRISARKRCALHALDTRR